MDAISHTAGLVPKTEKGNRTRALLKASARAVFGKQGYANARIADITAQAKLSQGSFYRYFVDKDDVLIELLDDLLHEVVNVARESWTAENPLHSVRVTTEKYLSFYEVNRDLYAILIEVAQSNEQVRAMWLQARDEFYTRIARMIRRAQAEGIAHQEMDPGLAAVLLGGMTEQYAYACYVERRALDVELPAVVTQISLLWAHGLFRDTASVTAGDGHE